MPPGGRRRAARPEVRAAGADAAPCSAQELSATSDAAAKLLSMPVKPTFRDRAQVQRMSRRAFRRRFGRIEHETLEFKASANHLHESVVAMAMTRGGTILVGVADGGEITGHAIDQPALDRVADVAHETGVELRPRRLLAGGRAVLAIEVPPVPHRLVTTPDGRLLRRL